MFKHKLKSAAVIGTVDGRPVYQVVTTEGHQYTWHAGQKHYQKLVERRDPDKGFLTFTIKGHGPKTLAFIRESVAALGGSATVGQVKS